MPYITQSRTIPSPDWGEPPNGGTRSFVYAGSITEYHTNTGFKSTRKLYRLEGERYAGSQTTFSWRTGKGAEAAGVKGRPLTGPELSRLIYTGRDFDPDDASTLSYKDKRLSQWDKGHEFWTTVRKDTGYYTRECGIQTSVTARRLVGTTLYILELEPGYAPKVQVSSFPWPAPEGRLSVGTRRAIGSRLLLNAMPGKSQANLSQLVAEFISDGPLSLVQSAFLSRTGRTDSRLASDYLGYQFGWVPTIGDLKKIIKSLTNMTEIIDQFDRDSGKVVRRKRVAEPQCENKVIWHGPCNSVQANLFTKTTGGTYHTYDMSPWLNISTATVVVLDETTQNSSFSGAFSYGHPLSDKAGKLRGYVERADNLLGLKVSAETLWQLAPWSWLLDWFTNIGDCISIIDAQSEGTIIRYGYAMNSFESERTFTVSGLRIGDATVPVFLSSKATYKAAYRDRSTPFGFGVDVDSLSGYQWSILAALGMTKGPRILRSAEYR